MSDSKITVNAVTEDCGTDTKLSTTPTMSTGSKETSSGGLHYICKYHSCMCIHIFLQQASKAANFYVQNVTILVC